MPRRSALPCSCTPQNNRCSTTSPASRLLRKSRASTPAIFSSFCLQVWRDRFSVCTVQSCCPLTQSFLPHRSCHPRVWGKQSSAATFHGHVSIQPRGYGVRRGCRGRRDAAPHHFHVCHHCIVLPRPHLLFHVRCFYLPTLAPQVGPLPTSWFLWGRSMP